MNRNHAMAGACLLFASTAALADGASTISDASFTIEEITITARRHEPLPVQGVLTSVDIADGELFRDANVPYAWDLFRRMPGVQLTEYNQGNVSGKISLRAFNGEGEVNAVKLLIDGVPSNSNDGNMPYLDMVQPLEVERLEVVRGTNDPRYGLHAIAGSASLATRTGGNYREARLALGSWDTTDLQAAAGFEHGSLSQNYTAAVRDSLGYRDHAQSHRWTYAGKWNWSFANGASAGFSARLYGNEAQEPGYLKNADVASDPQQSLPISATDGGVRHMQQYAAHLDLPLGEALTWRTLAWRNHVDDERFVRFSLGASQQERDTYETHDGLRSTLDLQLKPAGWQELSLQWGLDAEWQANTSARWLTTQRVRTSHTREQHFTLNAYGAWMQAVLRPTAWLKVVPAWRGNWLTGGFDNQLNGVHAPMYHYGTISEPKLSAVVSLGQHASAYANWGRTFQVGVTAASYRIPPLVNDLKPAINTGWEVGLKLQPAARVTARVAAWRQTATDEWRRILNSPAGDSENVGETLRQGYDLQLGVQPVQRLQAWVSWSHQDSELVNPGAAALNTLGKEIDHVPHQVWSGGIDWLPTDRVAVTLDFNGQGSYYLERTNSTGRFGASSKLDLSVRFEATPRLTLEAQVRNLADQYSEYVWWDTTAPAQPLHAPASPRAGYVSARLKF